MTPPNPDQPQHPLAKLGARTLAFLIDTIIILVVFVVVAMTIGPITANILNEPYTEAGELLSYAIFVWILSIFLATVLVLVIWGGLFEGIKGRTPGKTVAGLKVASADDHTQTIGFARRIARELIRSLPVILYSLPIILYNRIFYNQITSSRSEVFEQFFVVLLLLSVLVFVLDHLWLLWDKERQALHDKMANSHIISREPEIIEQDLYNKRKLPGGLR